MNESNKTGRNHKLVVDYLEALLCETELDEHELSGVEISYEVLSKEDSCAQLTSSDDELRTEQPEGLKLGDVDEKYSVDSFNSNLGESNDSLEIDKSQLVMPELAAESVAAESVAAESVEAESIAAESVEAESVEAESVAAESVAAESVAAESVEAESVEAESVEAESVEAESVEAESVEAESVAAESVAAESVAAESVEAESVAAESVEAESVKAESVKAEVIESEIEEVDLQKEWAEIEPAKHEIEDKATLIEIDSEMHEEEQAEEQPVASTQSDGDKNDVDESVVERFEEEINEDSEVVNEMNIEEPLLDTSVEQGINCIIVLMYGLKLAIPFEQIEGHIRLSNVTLSLDNDREWILGDFTSSTMRTHVVDTAQILFGDNYDALKSNYNEMFVLEGKHWSIVFDKVIKAQNILLSEVTENPSPQFRPWLTGTYMAEKCALVNVSAMVKMFEEELIGQ